MSRQFSIWIVSPANYVHSRCFEEVALGLQEAFACLELEAPIVTDPTLVRGSAVVLGANLLSLIPKPWPERLVLFNLEQIEEGSPWMKPEYIELLKRYPVWDYSARNLARLKAHGIDHVVLCGIGYMPALTRIGPVSDEFDVLFVGSINQRRRAVLDELARKGKSVSAGHVVYGDQRDKLISAAKVVLNMHYYESQVFEIVRVSYLLANSKCVVSESGQDDWLEAPLRDGIAFTTYEGLTETCLRLLEQPRERARLAATGFERFCGLSQVPMLSRALASLGPD
jgi:hypothetical protein